MARYRAPYVCSLWFGLIHLAGFIPSLAALTLEELRQHPQLDPIKFARYFANFRYQFHADVQTPAQFLSRRSGDCDDFATLAALVLREKGYTPRLVAVRMGKLVHVVCYIEETKVYLDYNLRRKRRPGVATDGSLQDIASKVSRSYRRSWSSASEFTFSDGTKRHVTTVLQGQAKAAALVSARPPSVNRPLAATETRNPEETR